MMRNLGSFIATVVRRYQLREQLGERFDCRQLQHYTVRFPVRCLLAKEQTTCVRWRVRRIALPLEMLPREVMQ